MSNIPTKEQHKRWNKIASLGCVICGGLAAIHHCKTHSGGRKDHDKVIPLCGLHHQHGGEGVAFHPFWKKWEFIYGSEDFWLEILSKEIDNI